MRDPTIPANQPIVARCHSADSHATVSTNGLLQTAGLKSPSFGSIHQVQSAPSNDKEPNTLEYENILANFRQEDVVYALMAHLREREVEFKRNTEQRNLTMKQKLAAEAANTQLQGAILLQMNLLEAKDKVIQTLEQKLEKNREKLVAPTNSSEDMVNQLTEEILSLNSAQVAAKQQYNRVIGQKNDEIFQLKSEVGDLTSELSKIADKVRVSYVEDLEDDLEDIGSKLREAERKNVESQNRIEELRNLIKTKEWMIKSLKQDNEHQCHREKHLLVNMRGLQDRIESFETEFVAKGVDVPIVLAKLQDSQAHNKVLMEKIRQLEVHISVMRLEYRKHNLCEATGMLEPHSTTNALMEDPNAIWQEKVHVTNFPSYHLSMSMSEDEDMYSMIDPFDPKVDRDELSLLIQDVKDGIESIQNGGLCRCAYSGKTRIEEPVDDISTAEISETMTG